MDYKFGKCTIQDEEELVASSGRSGRSPGPQTVRKLEN